MYKFWINGVSELKKSWARGLNVYPTTLKWTTQGEYVFKSGCTVISLWLTLSPTWTFFPSLTTFSASVEPELPFWTWVMWKNISLSTFNRFINPYPLFNEQTWPWIVHLVLSSLPYTYLESLSTIWNDEFGDMTETFRIWTKFLFSIEEIHLQYTVRLACLL